MKNDAPGFPFELKKPKAAKVSAISEATARSLTDPSAKINFHIGNPLQDIQLNKLYYKLCFGKPYNEKQSPEYQLHACGNFFHNKSINAEFPGIAVFFSLASRPYENSIVSVFCHLIPSLLFMVVG